MGCLESAFENPVPATTTTVVYNKWAVLSRSDPCFFPVLTDHSMRFVVEVNLKTITRLEDPVSRYNYAFINVPLTVGSQLTLTIDALTRTDHHWRFMRGFTLSLTHRTPLEILQSPIFRPDYYEVINFVPKAGDKITMKRLSDTQLVFSSYPDREQRCITMDRRRDIDMKDNLYPVLSMTGDVTQITIDSYIPNPAGHSCEMSDLERVFVLDPLREFTRTPLTNFVPIGDPVHFVLPACISDSALELAENNFAVKRIRRPFKKYNNLVFLDVDFPRGSKLVVRVESMSRSDEHSYDSLHFGISSQPPQIIESIQPTKDYQMNGSWFGGIDINRDYTRTVEDITLVRKPDGAIILTTTDHKSIEMKEVVLDKLNDIYPFFLMIGAVDRMSLLEYRRGDGRNVQDLGLDLVPAL